MGFCVNHFLPPLEQRGFLCGNNLEDFFRKKFPFASIIIFQLNRRTSSRFFFTQKSPKPGFSAEEVLMILKFINMIRYFLTIALKRSKHSYQCSQRICHQRESAPLKSVSTRFPLCRSDIKGENQVLAKKRENKNLKNNHLIREKIDEKRCFIDTPQILHGYPQDSS